MENEKNNDEVLDSENNNLDNNQKVPKKLDPSHFDGGGLPMTESQYLGMLYILTIHALIHIGIKFSNKKSFTEKSY